MRQVGFSDNARGRQVCPGCGRRLTFFLSSGLSFFIASWRAVSSFFFSSAEEVALIFVMKENVCAKAQPVGFGLWSEEPHGGDGAGCAPCTAECRRAAHPRSTTSSYPCAACRAEIAERTGVICEARAAGVGKWCNWGVLTAEAAGFFVAPGAPGPFPGRLSGGQCAS